MTLQDRIDEVTRILTTWPDVDRLAGVLRVVRAMGEELVQTRIDLSCDGADAVLAQGMVDAQRERDARPTLAQARAWCKEMIRESAARAVRMMRAHGLPNTEQVYQFVLWTVLPSFIEYEEPQQYAPLAATGQGPARERQLASPPDVGACVTPAPEPLSDDECWRRYLLADPDGEREAVRDKTGAVWKRDAIDVTRRCILAPTLRKAWQVLLSDGWDEDCVELAARAIRGEPALPPATPDPARGDIIRQWLQQSGPISTPEEYAALRELERWFREDRSSGDELPILSRIDAARKEASK